MDFGGKCFERLFKTSQVATKIDLGNSWKAFFSSKISYFGNSTPKILPTGYKGSPVISALGNWISSSLHLRHPQVHPFPPKMLEA